MLIESLSWISTVLSVIGVVLNIRKKRSCFYFWTVANLIWIYVSLKQKIYAQTFLFLVYLALSIWGFFVWKKEQE